jgi:hypothetical protein
MKLVVCLLLSMAAGFATYLMGAVIWATLDPLGAGSALIFTLPPAIAGLSVPALVALLAAVNPLSVWR